MRFKPFLALDRSAAESVLLDAAGGIALVVEVEEFAANLVERVQAGGRSSFRACRAARCRRRRDGSFQKNPVPEVRAPDIFSLDINTAAQLGTRHLKKDTRTHT